MPTEEMMQIMAKAVRITTNTLTDGELNALYMVALLGTSPKRVMGYEKAKDLFTEDNDTKMHPTTLDAFRVCWEERLGKGRD